VEFAIATREKDVARRLLIDDLFERKNPDCIRNCGRFPQALFN
jgi:hypothetical protein